MKALLALFLLSGISCFAQTLSFGGFSAVPQSGGGGGGGGLLNNLTAVWKMEQATSADAPDATGGGFTLAHHSVTTQNSTHIEGSFSTALAVNTRWFDTTSATLKTTGSFSLLVWVYPDSDPQATWLASRWDSGHAWALLAVEPSSTPLMELFVRNAADNGSFTALSTTALTSTTWHMVVITYDGASKVAKLSVDNETFVSTGATDGLNAVSEMFTLGQASDGIAQTWLGSIDHAAYWDGRALSQADVSTLWNSGAGLFYPSWTN